MSIKELDFQKVQRSFSAQVRDPNRVSESNGIEERRMAIYQNLFFNNVDGFISGGFPVLKELLSQDHWTELVRDFFIHFKCETPYFLEISEEFLKYLQESELDFLPVFSYQLAHWEWMELHADIFEVSKEQKTLTDLNALQQPVTLIESAWCIAYDYPVHKISKENQPTEETPTYLMIYRNPQDEVGFNELNPLSAMLFECLQNNQNKTPNEILMDIARGQFIAKDSAQEETVIQGGNLILEQWFDLGMLTAC